MTHDPMPFFELLPLRAIPCGPATAIENCWKCRRVKERCRCDKGEEYRTFKIVLGKGNIKVPMAQLRNVAPSPPSGVRRFVSANKAVWIDVSESVNGMVTILASPPEYPRWVGMKYPIGVILGSTAWGWTEVPSASSSGTGS